MHVNNINDIVCTIKKLQFAIQTYGVDNNARLCWCLTQMFHPIRYITPQIPRLFTDTSEHIHFYFLVLVPVLPLVL